MGDSIIATFVLCHGAWTGGWQWQEVASLLRSAGHQVLTPTLSGLGERIHFAHPDIDLNTYIQDILMVLTYEDLYNVILLGHSISGAVISGVAEKAVERIGQLVYLDAYVLEDGQSVADQVGEEIMAEMEQTAQTYGDGWRVPPEPSEEDRRFTDQSLTPVLTPLAIKNPAAAKLPRTFIHCTQAAKDIGPLHLPIAQAAKKAKIDNTWHYRELNTGHTPMCTSPQELVDILLDLV